MYDTIIIGAGMSGLAAGIRLAHFNQRVCILERHSTIGGLNSFYRQRGRNFDVGLHAVTNFAPKGSRHGPLARLLRQLRLRWDELALSPQIGSEIAFPDVRLRFSNNQALLESEIAARFPDQIDGFRRLVASIADYDELRAGVSTASARAEVARYITDPLLADMLFCPLLYYGGAREHDMEMTQFSIMFRAIYLEGLARPLAGVRLILKQLAQRFKSLGGELRLRAGVERIEVRDKKAEKVVLEDGTELTARHILSSAGWHETMQLCNRPEQQELSGGLAFIEAIVVLDTEPRRLGHDRTIVFYNDSDRFDYRDPGTLADFRSGMICSPNNFIYDEPMAEGMLRITALANYDRWAELDESQYRLEKLRCYDRLAESAARFMPDFRSSVIDMDLFTPKTITRFTGRQRGAIYGSPEKRHDGRTHLDNLYICGADQGLVGIVGTLISGIAIANQYLLD